MTRFFSSDYHFGHFNVIKYCSRPFNNTKDMNEALISRHNSRIGAEDELIFLGDFAMDVRQILYTLPQLNFKSMIWILGNHDKKTVKMIEKSGDIRPIRVLDSYKTNIGKYPVLISHYPYKGEGDYVDRFREKRQEDKGLPLLHGHSHRPRESKVHLSPRGTLQLDLGVDGNDFTPYSEEEVKSLIDEHYARRE